MLISEINPFIRFAKKYILLPKNSLRVALDSRIFFIEETEKEGAIRIKNDIYPIKKNTLLYISANTPYKFKISGMTKVVSINFDFSQYRNTLLEPFETKAIRTSNIKISKDEMFIDNECLNQHIYLKDAESFLESLNKIIKEYSSEKIYFRETSSAILKLLLINVLKSHKKATLYLDINYMRNKELIDKVKNFIREHYKENLTNEIIAHQVDYHSYHLNRLFNKYEGISLHKYLNNYRILMSEKMLLETDESITFIATEVGFDNTTSFTQNFKAKNSITPSKYRNYNRGGL